MEYRKVHPHIAEAWQEIKEKMVMEKSIDLGKLQNDLQKARIALKLAERNGLAAYKAMQRAQAASDAAGRKTIEAAKEVDAAQRAMLEAARTVASS